MSKLIIATHNGNFHADDVFSVAALKCLYPEASVIRSRDVDALDKADIVLDVGGVYDPEIGRFDHHQRGGAGERDNGIPYSSFGLIWKKYGSQLCNNDVELAKSVDNDLVSVIDAVDCGYVEGVPQGISLSQTIAMFNPTWQENADFDSCFEQAVMFASQVLARFIAGAKGSNEAEAIVADAIAQAADPRVIVLESFTPWKKTVHTLAPQALYVIYPSESNQWRIQTVPVEPGSFEDRKPLPNAWAGLADNELNKVIGINDASFCHNGCFIAGAKSFTSIATMAKIALTTES
jgi:uncharacterized UPF0160 family protein